MQNLSHVPAHLEDAVIAFGLDPHNVEHMVAAERIDAAADALESAGIVETREDAFSRLGGGEWYDGDLDAVMFKVARVEHESWTMRSAPAEEE